MSFERMHRMNGVKCPCCGKVHSFESRVITGSGALGKIPAEVRKLSAKKVFLLSDENTFRAAGAEVEKLLQSAGISVSGYCFSGELEPDEHCTGSAFLHFDATCDMIVAVGSGVINDIGKLLSNASGKPYMIVATAPSMDGYASASSSMTRDGLKISLPSRCADVIVGDTDILQQAPMEMMVAGLGDMLAKYVSICEWRIAHLVTGEYYCEEIAQLIREAVRCCVENAEGILARRPEAVEAVFAGLVIGGVAMNYAGVSRPASGVEHYISHVLDMRGVEFGTPVRPHGIQCAVGTNIAVALYEKLKTCKPDQNRALAYVVQFDCAGWQEQLRLLLGKGAESMIALEEKERKYDPIFHEKRLKTIIENWDAILQIMEQELPEPSQLSALLNKLGAPTTLEELGTQETMLPLIFKATKDIRDKYVLSRLCWDLGIIEEII